ncbi:LANO_0E10396g1_1 [Lachancea nothofagi CBS 11611]|uniref:LANO_0E10396g1_1 n=1 Tax=Lachancea nothofagi CBS 11611 TaxID=1266666 RepID=A0A1G4JWR2_9SACH|nr:LANO_0E10396g1_1 [Lachancea nothofagi CBS 11611]
MSSAILTADITQCLDLVPSNAAGNDRMRLMNEALTNAVWSPQNIGDQKLVTVQKPLLFQVCMVENIGKSKLSQLDDLKMRIDPKTQRIDRVSTSKNGPGTTDGNTDSGRQLITTMDIEADVPADLEPTPVPVRDKSVFKLTLQDKSGAMYFAINLSSLNFLKNDGNSCILGSKLVILPGAVFNRGMFTLRDSTVTFMGGMIQSWNRGRDYKLCEYLEAQLDPQNVATTRKRKAPAG